ncbi:hypothetical protein [uncultured Clostridium sp.]|uniref:hypothetical protein n=1 Tax=uncultured Clostridium sp. TaxID=59620 RepID=UPI003217ED89
MGIDYLNPQFQNPDGTTRIIGIWDQTIESNNNDDPIAFLALFIAEMKLIGLFKYQITVGILMI